MSFQVFIANDKHADGGPDEPANFTANVSPGASAATFASLTGKTTVLATSISHSKQGVELVVQGNDQILKVQGYGTPVLVSGGDKVGVAQWTVRA